MKSFATDISYQQWDGWKCLMGSEYSHALQLLAVADATYDIGPSQWLSYQNSFNHSLFLALQQWLQKKRLSGAVKTVGKDEKAVKFGTMVDRNQPFGKARPIIHAHSQCKCSSEYAPRLAPLRTKWWTRTQHLKKREQAVISRDLADAYAEMIGWG